MFVAGAETVILMALVAVVTGLVESFAWTVKLKVPVVVGIPEITPALVMFRPAGSEPFAIDQLYGAVPPLAVSVVE
jgi:Na+-transporting NADH:ubiquinone oxidoreductase subunit NqrD